MRNLCILMAVTALLIGCLSSSIVSAFPLSGGSGQANITVFGTIRDDINNNLSRIYVDIGAQDGFMGSISLVDEQDKFYHPADMTTTNIGWGKNRFFVPFDIPKGDVIKRLKFEPEGPHGALEPFSLNWEGIPEASDNRIKMKFYGAKSSPDLTDPEDLLWIFDVKLTNNLTTNIPIDVSDFSVIDQYGWEYEGKSHYAGGNVILGQLMPGESMRFDLTFSRISKLSRPVLLKYNNMQLDISASS